MNKNKHKNDDYKQLKTKLFFNTFALLAASFLAVFFLYDFVIFGRFADSVVAFLQFFNGDYDLSLSIYQRVFRNYITLYLLIAIIIIFGIALHIYLKFFTRYFNEINRGIDALITEGTEDVSLSPELNATERKINSIKHNLSRRKQEALLAEQRKNDLIVYLAHDLKTPLTSVIGYLTLLRDESGLSPELRSRYTGIALEKAERLEDLINEFFDITRFSLTTLTLELERTNISRMLEQIADEFLPVLSEKELTWELDLARDISLLLDPGMAERVFDNLIRNAVNYSYPKSAVFLSLKQVGSIAEICIRNHGKTIPPEKLEHIFEQFYRLDSSRSSATGGAGLGLAIAKEIVTLHGGSIEAESEKESILFTVRFPMEAS